MKCNASGVIIATALLGSLSSLPLLAQTVTIASDNAGNYSTWPGGSSTLANNGTGFGSWAFNNSQPNGGFSGQFLGGSYSTGGGINSGSGNAFGFYANSGNYALSQATLPLLEGAMTSGQTFSVQMQNHFIGDDGGQEGFNLQNSSGNDILQFYFNGGASDYYVNIWTSSGTSAQVDTLVPYTASPLTLNYTQGSGTSWTFAILEGSTTMATLTSAGTGDAIWQAGISQFQLFSQNGGDSGNQNDNVFFNNPQVTAVPEPTTVALGGASGLALLYYLRRRK